MKSDVITMSRAKFEALLDQLEDADDRVVVAAAEAREKALGKKAARADALPFELVTALVEGAHPVRVWRKHRGLTVQALSSATGIGQSYLTEIETRKKPGSLDAMIRIAAALGMPLDDITAWLA